MRTERPLSPHALGVLELAKRTPVLRQNVNPGVAAKLIRMGLVGVIHRPSPYPSRKGELVEWLTAQTAPPAEQPASPQEGPGGTDRAG